MSEVTSITKLEAVNDMLYDIGERPVSSLSGNSRLDVTRAEATLDRVTREVCTHGYWFNVEERDIVPNGSGEYIVPSNVVRVDEIEGLGTAVPVDSTTGSPANYVVRTISGVRKLINVVDQVSTGYTDTLTVRVSVLLEFEQLPQTARQYIYAKASALNILRAIGATELVELLEQQAAVLLAELRQEQISQADFRSTDSPRHFDLIYGR